MATKLARPSKLIPTFSPSSTIRGNYINRHVIAADLRKAKVESHTPDLVRPKRDVVCSFPSVEEVLTWLYHFEQADIFAFDIEVINYEVACISFSSAEDIGLVIPFGRSELQEREWTEAEEFEIWRAIQRVLGNPTNVKVVQNGIFDIQFLYSNMGIVVRGEIRDTMIAHHIVFPELQKSLGFLGSIYLGTQEYWKDAVKFDDIKENS